MTEGFVYIDVNPEPWAVGPLSVGKRNGKMFPIMGRNQSVHAFKEAVRDALEGKVTMLPDGQYDVTFFFWRRLESYVGESGRKANAHWADATNMQKATEDALQGILFDNDRDVREIRSVIVDQGPDVIPGIAVQVQNWVPTAIEEHFAEIKWNRDQALKNTALISDNTWPPA